MSEVSRLSSEDLRGWLERETSSLFVPIHSKAQRFVDDMRKMLDSLLEVSKMLLENSAKEIDKKNMKTFNRARALNKLSRLFADRIRQTKIPDVVTYDSFNQFVQETQRTFLVIEVDIRNWFPRVSPFFILDRRKFQAIFDKAKNLLQELGNFLTKEYVKAKTLEQTFELADKLLVLEDQATTLTEQKARIEDDKVRTEAKIAAVHEKMAMLRNSGTLSQLSRVNADLNALRVEVKHALHHLEKPFVKLQSLALHGEGSGLTPEQVDRLNHYVEDPFEAFSVEESGLRGLKQILEKTEQLMSNDKLHLKSDKARKAQQLVTQILNGDSLLSLHERSRTMTARRKQLSTSAEVTEAERMLSELKEQLEALETRMKVVEGEEVSIQRELGDTAERIRGHKSEIEKNVSSFLSKEIRIT